MKDLVPTDHGFVMLGQNLLQALVVVGLQILIRLHSVCLFKGLNLGIAVPKFPVDFVAANVEIGIGKKLSHLLDELVHELVSFFARWIGHRRGTTLVFYREWALAARQFRIANKP